MSAKESLIQKAYENFNARNIPQILETMTPDVHWPKAFEGDFVTGKEQVSQYWTRQWSEINPIVIPTKITENPDGSFLVEIHQTVKDLRGEILFDGTVFHTYFFENGLIQKMEISAN
ncbi:nuclear transport factor 2 family protein [Flavobacterium sp.]|uniref:nuclear transport factor 2 family protein n=1 Tax=Flavobacterium sp. TaxID=239 RepID=UPI001206522E|nr:nuclear transport factor 2 family protein [Flavobacterium sp.]RZJ71830.1 MAG: nuclear transport factor 2 family protein [Flavobacterium sp.]